MRLLENCTWNLVPPQSLKGISFKKIGFQPSLFFNIQLHICPSKHALKPIDWDLKISSYLSPTAKWTSAVVPQGLVRNHLQSEEGWRVTSPQMSKRKWQWELWTLSDDSCHVWLIQTCALLESWRMPWGWEEAPWNYLSLINLLPFMKHHYYLLPLLLFSLPYYLTIWASTMSRCKVDLGKTRPSLSLALHVLLTVELHFFCFCFLIHKMRIFYCHILWDCVVILT